MAEEPEAGAGLPHVLILFLCCFYPTFTHGFKNDPRNLFYGHAVVHPTVYSTTREKREIHSGEKKVPHMDKLTLGFVAFNKTFVVELFMNKDLFPETYFEKHHEDGKNVIHQPLKKEMQHCHYQGHLQGLNHTWAAISTCDGVSGVIYDGEELHYIEPDYASKKGHHLMFRASDMKPQNLTCGVLSHKNDISRSLVLEELQRHRRSTVLQEPYKSNSKSRFVELVIVNDNLEYRKFNRSKSVVFERSKQIANIVNGLYAPLNIFIALVGVIIWSEHDEIKLSTDGDVTLTNFLHYRRERLAQEHPNDNAQLITAMTFDGGVVGKALKGPICTYEYSGGVNMDHNDLVGLVATTVAHELGHNFGMEHDTDECQCPNEKCIMSPSSSSTSPRHWSSCSLEYLDLAYSHGMDYCLQNKPADVVGPVCGNGFLEDGEECDCGLKEFCDNPCCNATSCKLFSNASCAMGMCCDVQTCQVKKSATFCRAAVSECDLPEYCDGISEFCPSDIYYQNGSPCGNGKAFCYDGKCNSHADQCKLLWGETGKMSDARCFEQNYKGDVNGNCGYNRLNHTYKACSKQDVLCGMLHCTHLNEKLEFGMESAAILARSYITVRSKVLTCRSAIVDLGLYDTDPGLVPNGARCGDGRVCVNQKCVSVESIKGSKCLLDCSGNGVCNSLGHCHCFQGYGPPDCNKPGRGGSVDSGPASDTEGYATMVFVYVVFFGLVPLVFISTAVIVYYFRPHFKAWWIAKARKANIKCRAKQTVQRKPQPPAKFNFDRNSLRTLEISAPIQQVPSAANSVGSVHQQKERSNLCKTEISTPVRQNVTNNAWHTNKPVPVRPAPARPDAIPQRMPSWTPATAVTTRTAVRTSSLRVAPESNAAGRPPSLSSSRPNCPPPRPPPPKSNSAIPTNSALTYEDIGSNDVDRSSTPNSTYYDDCQTLDFSNTPLAFVHQTDPYAMPLEKRNPSSQDNYHCETDTVQDTIVLGPKHVTDKVNLNSKSDSSSVPKPMFQCTERTGPSLVASLAKKFEKQNFVNSEITSNPSQIRSPFKMRPLPPTPNNAQT